MARMHKKTDFIDVTLMIRFGFMPLELGSLI